LHSTFVRREYVSLRLALVEWDFFLLQLTLENDRRLAAERLPEIRATMEKIVEAAKADPTISLSIIDENNLVRPLTAQGFEDGIRRGNRQTTSALGDDYRVILDGLDGEMKWSRGGDVNLVFHLPYNFIIIPTSITSIPYED